jgi:hypothetical protein
MSYRIVYIPTCEFVDPRDMACNHKSYLDMTIKSEHYVFAMLHGEIRTRSSSFVSKEVRIPKYLFEVVEV